MKIIYIGDNRNRGNYGCRATSTALSMLVSHNNKIVGRVKGDSTYFYPDVFYFKYFPKWLYKSVKKLPYWNHIRTILSRVMFKVGRKIGKPEWFDFVSLDMERSIKNLKKCLPANPNLEQLDFEKKDYDGIVINGEGSFIFCTPQWREPLVISMCIYQALKHHKKVFSMNAMFSDRPGNQRNIQTLALVNDLLSKSNVVSVRESFSFEYAKKYLSDTNPIIIPDALFSWYSLINDSHKVTNGKYYLAHAAESDEYYECLDFTKPYILVSGSSSNMLGENMNKTIQAYSSLVKELKNLNYNIYLIQVCEGDFFLKEVSEFTNTPLISMETPILAAAKILSNARVYVSGRYHPAIMASLGGTPCIFMGSNSHKTLSLQELMNYEIVKEYCAIPTNEDIIEIVHRVVEYADNDNMRIMIKNRAFALSNESIKMKDLIK